MVYKGGATSVTDTGLSGGVTYDYKFYSVNNDYYSPGVTAQEETMDCTPSVSTGLFGSTGSIPLRLSRSAMTPATNYWATTSAPAPTVPVRAAAAGEAFSWEKPSTAGWPRPMRRVTRHHQRCLGMFPCIRKNQYPRSGYAARINDDTPNASIYTPELEYGRNCHVLVSGA